MILYILALGSPTHPVDSTAWAAWVGGYQWATFRGQSYVQFGPLFGHEYSHVWIDFRAIQDSFMRGRGIDYFENSRRATYAQRAYAAVNPMAWTAYSSQMWGLTASDGPANATLVLNGNSRQFHTYWARGSRCSSRTTTGPSPPWPPAARWHSRPRSPSPHCSGCGRHTGCTCSRPTASATHSTRPSPLPAPP